MLMRSTVFPFLHFFVRSNRGCLWSTTTVDPLNETALLRVSTKMLNFLSSLDDVLPFFIFVFKVFYEIYKEFLVYLIPKLIWQ